MTIIVNPSGAGEAQAALLQNSFPSAIDGLSHYPLVSQGVETVAADGTGDYPDIQSALDSGSGFYYVKAGTYPLSTIIQYTASGQVVFLDPAVIITIASDFTPPTMPSNANGVILMTLNAAGTETFSNVYWFGNGAVFNMAGLTYNEPAVTIAGLSTLPQPRNVVFADMQIINNPISFGVYAIGNTDQYNAGSQYDPAPQDRINNILISGIYYKPASNIASGQNMIALYGSLNNVKVQQCYVDCSGIVSGTDYDPIIVLSPAGNTHQAYIEECTFISNGVSGQVFEIGGAPLSDRTTEGVYFKGCSFVSTSTSVVYAGSGGGYIDQNDNDTATSLVRNITFDNCRFTNVGISFQSTTSDFGYIRFINRSDAPPFSGSIPSVTPGTGGAAITVGASPFTYTNSDGFDEDVIITGGTVTDIAIDGESTTLTQSVFTIGTRHTITVTYTSAPTIIKIGR